MGRYLLRVAYDGSNYFGWQKQPGKPTVQGEIEKSFSLITQQTISIMGSGRTDTGVHAENQAAHVDLPNDVNPVKLIKSVNRILNSDIRIMAIDLVDDTFHARFDAIWREYRYQVTTIDNPLIRHHSWYVPYTLSIESMRSYSEQLIGVHSYRNFSKGISSDDKAECTVMKSEIQELNNGFIFKIRANRFLRNMVRCLTAAMIELGRGKLSELDIENYLNDSGRSRFPKVAPAKGLVLEFVSY